MDVNVVNVTHSANYNNSEILVSQPMTMQNELCVNGTALVVRGLKLR